MERTNRNRIADPYIPCIFINFAGDDRKHDKQTHEIIDKIHFIDWDLIQKMIKITNGCTIQFSASCCVHCVCVCVENIYCQSLVTMTKMVHASAKHLWCWWCRFASISVGMRREEREKKNIKYHFIWYEVIKQSSENEVIYDCQLVLADEFLVLFLNGMPENAASAAHWKWARKLGRRRKKHEWMVILSENDSYYKRAIITSN